MRSQKKDFGVQIQQQQLKDGLTLDFKADVSHEI